MPSANWISLASVLVAIVALGVSGFAYYLQRHANASSDENEFNALVEKIEKELAILDMPKGNLTPEVYATGVHVHGSGVRILNRPRRVAVS